MNLEGLDLHATHKELYCFNGSVKWLIYVNNFFYGYLKYDPYTRHYAVTREWFPTQKNWVYDEPGVTMEGESSSNRAALALMEEQIQNKNITYNLESEDPVKITVAVNGQNWGLFTQQTDDSWILQYSAFPKLQIWATAPEDTGDTFVCFEGTKVPGTEFRNFNPIEKFTGNWEDVKRQFEKQVKQNFDNEEKTETTRPHLTRR